MAKIDATYQQLVKDIISRGFTYNDPNRKGVKRKQLTDYRIKHDILRDGFPLLTLRKIHYGGAIGEFVSFMRGENNIIDLQANGVNFWAKDGFNYYKKKVNKNISFDAYKAKLANGDREAGDLGKIYPHQMRNWNGEYDQIFNLVKTLLENPMATKKTVTMWNPTDMEDTSLSECHWSFEALTEVLTINQREEYLKHLSLIDYEQYMKDTPYKDRDIALDGLSIPRHGLTIKWHQHSVDVFLGLPTNIAYYAIMCIVLAVEVNMMPMGIIGDLSNVHIYDNALKASYEILKRNPNTHGAPSFRYRGRLHDLSTDCFSIEGYKHDEPIKVEMLAYA